MIGLKRHTVQIVQSHPHWMTLAKQICATIRQTCTALIADVQHVGSTSVPDLPAKPILDIVVAIQTTDAMPDLIDKLSEIGCIYRRYSEENGGHLFVMESAPDVRTAHIHVVLADSSRWFSYLRFRDILRNDPTIRRRYAALKRQLRDQYPDDRKTYTASKNRFIRSVLDEPPGHNPIHPKEVPHDHPPHHPL